jgi:hypothetical protein
MIAEFSAGKIVNDSFKLYLRHFPALFLVCLPLFAAGSYFSATGEILTNPYRSAGIILMLSLIVTPLSTGALTHSVYQSLRSKPVSVGESLSVGLTRFGPLLGVAVCTALFVVGGLFLFIIPGLMLATLLYVASPVSVVEKKGVFESMQRSRTLTSGRKWQIFVIMIGINILMSIVIRIVEVATSSAISPGTGALVFALGVQFFFQAISIGWNATAAALSYYHLRSIHESVDIEDIANVFD